MNIHAGYMQAVPRQVAEVPDHEQVADATLGKKEVLVGHRPAQTRGTTVVIHIYLFKRLARLKKIKERVFIYSTPVASI